MRIFTTLALLAAATLPLAAAPAMAQYIATPYGNNGMLLQPNNNGQTFGYQSSPSPQPTFVIPNVQFQQPMPHICPPSFAGGYRMPGC